MWVNHLCKPLWGQEGTAAAGASAQRCTGMTSWPNTIHCPAYDDIMSFGIKSFAIPEVNEGFL